MKIMDYFIEKFYQLYWNLIKLIGHFKFLIRKICHKKTKYLNSIEDYLKLSELFLDIIGVCEIYLIYKKKILEFCNFSRYQCNW